jgi:hypothetical protein
MACIHKSNPIAERDGTQLFRCNLYRVTCVTRASDLQSIPGANAIACESNGIRCGLFSEPPVLPPELAYLRCDHRGDTTGKSINCQCGIDRTIYQCDLHGKCLKKLPPTKTREDLQSDLEGVAICADCETPRKTNTDFATTLPLIDNSGTHLHFASSATVSTPQIEH